MQANPYAGLLHSRANPYGGLLHSTDLTLQGIGMGVEQALEKPVIKLAVVGLAAYGAACLFGFAKPKPKKRRNPRRKSKAKKRKPRRRN